MNSSGVRRERSVESRLAQAILDADQAQIQSEKVFKGSGLGADLSRGIANNRSGAGNSLEKSGDIKSGPFGNEFISTSIVNDSINASITSPNYFPFLLLQGEGGADDDLDSIFPGTSPLQNRELTLQAGNNTITLKQNFGSDDNKILTPNGADIVMETGDLVFMIYSFAALAWIVTGKSDIVTAAKSQDLGDLNSGFVVNFDIFDDRQLYANQVIGTPEPSNVILTFTNIPPNLATNLKIYMLNVNTSNSLVIGGTTIYDSSSDPFNIKPLAVTDFLSIEFESSDQANITITSVKKNDDTGAGDVIPGIPGNIYAIGNTSSSVVISWDQPETGTLPITYDIAWSTSPAGNSTDGPTTPAAGSPLTGITENLETVTGLAAATTYYFWVRGVNTVGGGLYAGPQQTNTEGTTNPGSVNFAIPGGTVLFNSITITWDQPGALLFTLFRTDPDGTVTTFQRRSTADADIVDTSNIQPNTNYNYTLETYNEFGSLLGTQTINVNADNLPVPVLTLVTVSRKLQFTVTIPAGINICQVDWDLTNSFGATIDSLQMVKTVAKDTAQVVVELTNELNISTEYFVRARFQLNNLNGTYNTTQSIITGTLSIPLKPEIDNSTSGNADGVMKIGVDFANATSTGEVALCKVRATSSVGNFFPFPGNSFERDNKPIDNIASPSQEDEIMVPRAGGGWGAVGIITVVSGAVTSITITNGGNNYVSGSTVRIYDDDDNGGGDGQFQGTAIVSGGQLTGVTIVNGGDFYNNGNTVFLPANTTDPNISGLFVPGGVMTARIDATNQAGTSDADTETVNVL